jgi:protein-tyrosine phosphatase
MELNGRLLPLQGAKNFRDIGGLPARDGRSLRRGVFFRSDELSALTRQDLAILEPLGLRLVIDMRTASERGRKFDRLSRGLGAAGPRYVHLPIAHPEGSSNLRQMWRIISGEARTYNFDGFIRSFYQHIAFGAPAQIGQALTLLSAAENRPALVHCTAGKDRTGFIAALLQLLAGVDRETVIADYLLTNEMYAPRMRRMQRNLRWLSLFQAPAEGLQAVLEARREYLEDTLDELLRRYGSVDNYLHTACSLQTSTINQLRAAFD